MAVNVRRMRPFAIANALFFVLLSVVTLYPFWHTIVGSLISFSEFVQRTVLIFPRRPTLAGYAYVLAQRQILDSFMVSVFSTAVGAASSLVMTSLAGYVLAQRGLPGRNAMFVFVLVAMLFSGGLIPLYVVLSRLRLVNNIWVYILPGLINTFYVIIMKTSFQEIPDSLVDAARMDGCTDFGILFRVVVPLSLPVMATIALFYAVNKWNNLFTAIFFITDARKLNLQAVLYNIVSSADMSQEDVVGKGDMAMVSEQIKYTTIVVATAPILVVYPFLQKYFIKGVLIGAIKE